jgi:hypothetical protein
MNSPITVWRWELDEFDARAVENDVLIDIADCAADHSPLYYDRALTKRESKIVEGNRVGGRIRFRSRCRSAADAFARERLQHHHFAVKLPRI